MRIQVAIVAFGAVFLTRLGSAVIWDDHAQRLLVGSVWTPPKQAFSDAKFGASRAPASFLLEDWLIVGLRQHPAAEVDAITIQWSQKQKQLSLQQRLNYVGALFRMGKLDEALKAAMGQEPEIQAARHTVRILTAFVRDRGWNELGEWTAALKNVLDQLPVPARATSDILVRLGDWAIKTRTGSDKFVFEIGAKDASERLNLIRGGLALRALYGFDQPDLLGGIYLGYRAFRAPFEANLLRQVIEDALSGPLGSKCPEKLRALVAGGESTANYFILKGLVQSHEKRLADHFKAKLAKGLTPEKDPTFFAGQPALPNPGPRTSGIREAHREYYPPSWDIPEEKVHTSPIATTVSDDEVNEFKVKYLAVAGGGAAVTLAIYGLVYLANRRWRDWGMYK